MPRYVFLFSGHMIDRRGRSPPRFPPDKEPIAAAAIAAALDELGAGSEDLGITEGACGGDLLFAEAMLERGASLDLHLPFEEAEFIARSVAFEKPESRLPDRWQDRFLRARNHPRARLRIMAEALGAPPAGTNAYEHCNAWMLDESFASGAKQVHFVCLWDGKGGDGPGGTEDMRREVSRRGGSEHWLDTENLWGLRS